jgi:hypothetical protein
MLLFEPQVGDLVELVRPTEVLRFMVVMERPPEWQKGWDRALRGWLLQCPSSGQKFMALDGQFKRVGESESIAYPG